MEKKMPKASLHKEKRIYPRISATLAVHYRELEDQKAVESLQERRQKEISAITRDVSLGGMFLVAEKPLTVGHMLVLHISVPNHPGKLSAYAEVVWSNTGGGGLKFLAMSEEYLGILQSYLDSISEK
jgi:c-di-GMP-binding flagellar brake protein YcgR